MSQEEQINISTPDNKLKGTYTFEISEIKEDLLTNIKPSMTIDCNLKIEATGKEPKSILTSLFEEIHKLIKIKEISRSS